MNNQELQQIVVAVPLTHFFSSLAPPLLSAATSGASITTAASQTPLNPSLDVITAMTKVPAIILLLNT